MVGYDDRKLVCKREKAETLVLWGYSFLSLGGI